MTLGEKIKNAREDKDLLQSDVAGQIPMNQSNYSKIERNLQEPNILQLRRICQILDLDPAYLLGLEKKEFSSQDLKLLSDIKKLIKNYST